MRYRYVSPAVTMPSDRADALCVLPSWASRCIGAVFVLSISVSLFCGTSLPDRSAVSNAAVFRASVMRNDTRSLRRMLDSGVSPNIVPDIFLVAARLDAYDAAKLLLDRGATNMDVVDTWMHWNETPVTKALKLGNSRTARLLIERGAAVDVPTCCGWTALMFAAKSGDVQCARSLIRRGARVQATNSEGYTALMIAADRGNSAMMQLLTSVGADASYTAPDGMTAARITGRIVYPASLKGKRSSGRYSSIVDVKTPEVTLHYAGDSTHRPLSVTILPSIGNRIMSLRYDGTEMLHRETHPGKMAGEGGIPILYPTPNRVQDGTFRFAGKTHVMKHPFAPYPVGIHGLVIDDRWEFAAPAFTSNSVQYRAWYDCTPANPRFSAFPWEHRLTVIYTLSADSLRITYRVENVRSRMGFGFGLHPYWRIIGTPADIRILADIPTTIPGMTNRTRAHVTSANDLSRGRSLADLPPLNEMYFPLTASNKISIMTRSGIRIDHRAHESLTHLIAWTPPGKPYFSVEHQTSSADAHNLYARGVRDISHLIIAEPGQTHEGSVEYVFSRMQNK